jgi:hypothetical protein
MMFPRLLRRARGFTPILAVAVTALTVGVSTVVGATGAQAATIDFTDGSAYRFRGKGFSGAAGGLDYTVSTEGTGKLTRNRGFDGDVAPSGTGLALEFDGLGVRDDEITIGREKISVAFARTVRVTALHFLDLFAELGNPSNREQALVSFDGGRTATFAAQRQQNHPGTPDLGGYAGFTGLDLVGSRFVFSVATPSNDQSGRADFSLAAIEASPVPLPAGFVLLATALGGLCVMRRRAARVA